MTAPPAGSRRSTGPCCGLFVVLAWLTSAQADVVRVVSGPRFGQGWMFLDQDGRCKVLTAAHVVQGQGGASRHVDVLTTDKATYPTSDVVDLNGVDIAVVGLTAADAPSRCGSGRLSATGAERRLREMSNAWIDTTEETGVTQVPVVPRGSSIDESGGAIFAVLPSLPKDTVVEGWSGSVVMDRYGPLGIVTEVNAAGEALAVRVDVIRRLMTTTTAPAPESDQAGGATFVVRAGDTPDQARGPARVFDPTEPGWEVRPAHRTIVFETVLRRASRLGSITLEASSGSEGLEALAVSTSAELGAPSIDVARCAISTGRRLECRFAPRTVRTVTLVVTAAGDHIIGLHSLVLR